MAGHIASEPGSDRSRRFIVMLSLHQEHHFESEICQSLATNGWLYAEDDAEHYDRTNGIFLPDLLEYDETQVERNTAMKGIMNWVRLHTQK